MAASKKKKTVKLTDQVFTATIGMGARRPKKAKLPQLVKPKQHTQTFWDYLEVAEYLEKLHKKDFRDYADKHGKNPNGEYQDFWHWLVDVNGSFSNGCFIHLPDESWLDAPEVEPWKKEIMKYFMDFLGDDYEEKLWVSW